MAFPHAVLVDQSTVVQTFEGIDSCGDRLATEIKAKVQQHQSLTKISFIGHSMGGLLVRYAAGRTCTQLAATSQ